MVDRSETGATARKHPALLRMSAIGVAGLLSVLMLTAVAPPIVADQSDRAVVNAPVTLLTAPIGGEIDTPTALSGSDVRDGDPLAPIRNPRLHLRTLILPVGKSSHPRQKAHATPPKTESEIAYG